MSSKARLFLSIGASKVGSGVTGESQDADYKGKIELDDWNWSFERKEGKDKDRGSGASSNLSVQGGSGFARPEPAILGFSKVMDRSTIQLLNRLKSGEQFLATLTLIENSDLWFEVSVNLFGARVNSYKMSGKDEDKGSQIDETWTLNYDYITFEQTSQPMSRTQTTVVSNRLRRLPNASNDVSDSVEKVYANFSKLSSAEKIDVLAQIRDKFPDEMKGQASAQPRSLSPKAKIEQVVKAFEDLSKDEQKQARKKMGA